MEDYVDTSVVSTESLRRRRYGPMSSPSPPSFVPTGRPQPRRHQQRQYSIQFADGMATHSHQQQAQPTTMVNHSPHQYALQPNVMRNGADNHWWDSTANMPSYVENGGGLLDWLGRLFWRLVRLFVLLMLSTLSYAVFYKYVMPREHSVKELQFDYTGETWKQLQMQTLFLTNTPGHTTPNSACYLHSGTTPTINDSSATHSMETESPTQLVEHRPAFLPRHLGLLQETTRQHQLNEPVEPKPIIPTAIVDLYAKHNNWCAVEPSILPEMKSRHLSLQRPPRLKAQQAYYVDIILQLPESDANRNAGMFGVVTELHGSRDNGSNQNEYADRTNTTLLAVARRSSRFPHQTPWINTVLKIVLLVPILLQAMPEAKMVTVSAFRQYIETEEHPLQNVVVQIVQPHPSSVATAPPVIEVLGGELRIGEELSDAQEILKTWFYSCFCFGVIAFAILYQCIFFFLIIMWRQLRRRLIRATKLQPPGMENDMFFSDLDWDVGDMDFESVDVNNDLPFPHEHRTENRTTEQHDTGENDEASNFDSHVNPSSVVHEQPSLFDLDGFEIEMGAQGGTASNNMGRTFNLERHGIDPTMAANRKQTSSLDALPSESFDRTKRDRPMRINEILEEDDGSSSWEDLIHPAEESLDGVASGPDASLAQQLHQEISASRGGSTSLLAGNDLVDSLLLGNGHNCSGVNGSRDVRDVEPRSIFSFFTC